MKRALVTIAVCVSVGTVGLGAESAPPKTGELHASVARPAQPTGPQALAPVTPSACPEGMLLVEGDYCEGTVGHACKTWVDGQMSRDRCAEYHPSSKCYGRETKRRFCIDAYEFPNRPGVKPVTGMNWDEAQATCTSLGKRLCKDQEWTLACEGPERLPYPNGYARDANACNFDRPYIMPNNDRYNDPATRADEFARLDQRVKSGERAACVSAYGVHDMTGNVDEWVVNEKGKVDDKPYKSGLKGGWWGPVRNRCRPMTTDHNQWHMGWAIGFRCCADAP
jgi:hypothetical protein